MAFALYLVGDSHLTTTPSSTCTLSGNSFINEQMERLYEISEKARENYMSYEKSVIVIPGDIVDKWNASPEVFYELSKWTRFNQENGFTTVTTLGQHDVRGKNYTDWQNNSFLHSIPGLQVLTTNDNGIRICGVPLRGIEHGAGPYWFSEQPKMQAGIWVWHVSASTDPTPTINKIESLPLPNEGIILCGDIHNFVDHLQLKERLHVFSAGSLLPMNYGDQTQQEGFEQGFWFITVGEFADDPDDYDFYDEVSAEFVPFTNQLHNLYEAPRERIASIVREQMEEQVEEMMYHIKRINEETLEDTVSVVKRLASQLGTGEEAVQHVLKLVQAYE